MKKKTVMKKVLSIGLASAMVLSLAACGSEKKEDEKKQEGDSSGVTLEFQQWWGVELPEGALQKICDDFTKDTGIQIELLSNPYADTKTQIAAGAAAGTMADVVGLDGAWVYDFAKQGSISNLTELMKEDGYDDSQLSDQIKYEGNTYMIPVVNFAYPLYVNMDILEKAGVSEIPATWSEFLAALDKIDPNLQISSPCRCFSFPLHSSVPAYQQSSSHQILRVRQ